MSRAGESTRERLRRELDDLAEAVHKVLPKKSSDEAQLTMAAQTMARALRNVRELRLARRADKIARAFDRLSEPQQINWIRRYERGDRSMPMAEQVEALSEAIIRGDKASGVNVERRANYLPHRYKNFREYVEREFERSQKGRAAEHVENTEGNTDFIKGGKAAFQNERLFPTLEDAIQRGLKPRSTNVGDMLMDRIQESMVVRSRLDTLKTLERNGTIRPYIKDEELAPGEKVWRTTDYGAYVVPEDAQALLNNGVFSASTWDAKSLGARAFRRFMSLKNAIVISRLGLSLFHFTHMLLIRPASAFANTFRAYADAPVNAKSIKDFSHSYVKHLVFGTDMGDVRFRNLWHYMHGKDVKLNDAEKTLAQYMLFTPRAWRTGILRWE